MKSLLSKKCSFIFSLLSLSLFVSCGDFFSPDWGTPAKEFFKEYTETSAVMQLEYDAEFPKNKDGIVCIPCNDDHSITFYLRNPQNYTLAPHYEFKDSFVSDIQGYTFVQDAEDKSLVKLSFTKEFLRTLEDRDSNDLSGTVSLLEPKSGRVFDHFEVSLHANSAPPEIKSPCFQLSNASGGEYVVCFYFPKLFLTEQGYNNPLHRDSYQFIVNGHTYYIKAWQSESPISIYENYTEDESGPSVSNPSSYFTTTAPTGLTSLRADGFVFNPDDCPEGYVAMYYLTGQQQSPNDIRYTFTIRDREGLSNSIAISNKAQQLNPPAIQVASGQSYAADEYTGLYTLSISHDGLCTDGSSCGAVTIHYTITDSNGRTTTGSAKGSARISLASGTYTISSYATKDYYIASESVESTQVKIFSPAIYYVSNQGRDAGDSPEDEPTGAITDPFRTIGHALEVFRLSYGNNEPGGEACEIRLLTDITPTTEQAGQAFGASENYSLISIPQFTWNPAIFIRGYNGKRTIDAKRNETISGRVISNMGANLTLENLVITGGYAKNYTNSTGEKADGGAIYSLANISLTDCVIQNNSACNAENGGGAIYVSRGKTLTMTRCTLSNNEACVDCSGTILDPEDFYISGGAIYALGDCTLTDCTISENIGEGALVVAGTLRMKGGKVTNNKSMQGSCAAGITMCFGILDGVEISGNYFVPAAELNSLNGGGVCIYNLSDEIVDPSESGASVIIRNCTIKNNKAYTGAGVYYSDDGSSVGYCLIENTTITQNTSYMGYTDPGDEGSFAAGIYITSYNDTIKLRGTNIITGNTLNDGKAADLALSEGKKLIIGGSLGKSRIGIYMLLSETNKPTPGNPFDFTKDYAIANSSVAPGEYFIAENGYGIAANNAGEASFAVSGGSLYSALDYRVSVSSVPSQSELKTVLGKSKTYTFKVSASRKEEDLYYNRQDKKLYLDEQMQKPVNDERVNWSAALFSGGYKVSDLEVTTSASGSPELSITVPAQSFEDTYLLKVYANYMGITTDSNFTYSVIDPSLFAADIDSVNAAIAEGGLVEVVGRVTQEQLTDISGTIRSGPERVQLDLSSMAGITELTVDFATGGQYGAGNTYITSLILPNCLETLGDSSLWGLYYLSYLYIPKSVTHIEGSAFFLCADNTGLDIELEEGNEVYDLIDGCIVTKDHKTLVRYANGTTTGNITIPACIETIASCAFTGSRFSSITFEEGSQLKTIETYAFDGCSRLYSVNDLPLSLEKLEYSVWRYCSSLYSITYKGTLDQWNSIEKPDPASDLLGFGNYDVSVSCSDGNATIPK